MVRNLNARDLVKFKVLSFGKDLSRLCLPMKQHTRSLGNQNVENAGLAFLKGANERNEFFDKINKQ